MKRCISSLFTVLLFSVLLYSLSAKLTHAQTPDHFDFSTFTSGSPKAAGIPFPITIYAKDVSGATIPSFVSTVLLNNTTDTIYPIQTNSFTNGVWQGDIYITEAKVDDTIIVTYSTTTSVSDPFTVIADNRIKFLTITSGVNQIGNVGTTLPSALILRVVDPYNNPLSNVGVNFAINSYPPGATYQSLSNYSSTSNASGYAQTSLTLGRKSGSYVVTGTLSSGITNAVNFYETATPGTLVSLSLTPTVAVLISGASMPFTASGYDSYSNPITLTTQVGWSVLNGGGIIDSTGLFTANSTIGTFMNTVQAVTGNIGTTATVTIVGEGQPGGSGGGGGTGTGSGEATASATPTPTATTAPTATPTPAAGVLYNIQVDPTVITALTDARIPIVAEGVDIFGNKLQNINFEFTVEGNLGTITQTGPNTILLTATENGIGTVTVTASQGSLVKMAKIVGSVGTGLNRRLIIEDIQTPQTAGEPFTISIAAKDSSNNFITDYKGPIVLADTTATIDPAVVQPNADGIWYIQAIISLAAPEVTITAAGDGMIGVSNIFEVVGSPLKSEIGPGAGGAGAGAGGGLSEVLGASISGKIDELLKAKNLNKYTIVRYIGGGLAAGFGILGASIGGGIMVSRGLEAIGRNPYAKGRLQVNLYASMFAFIISAALAVIASFLIIK